MIRRSILTGAALLLILIVLPATASTAEARPNVVGTGITHCNGGWVRGLKFAPPLVNGGVAASETVTLTTTMPACAGGVPVPTSGVLLGKGVVNMAGANNCASYFAAAGGTDPFTFGPGAAFAGKITWTPAVIAPSNFSLATISATTTVPLATVTFTAVAIAVSGSYPTPTAGKFKFHTVKTLATILGGGHNCAGVGLSALKIVGPGSKGKF
jgi:hypothetical protein